MSRIGKKAIPIVDGVRVDVADRTVTVEGPKGKLQIEHRPEVTVTVDEGLVRVNRHTDDRNSRQMHGLTRALINNMIDSV